MLYFTTDSQVKLYRGTVLTIMNSGHGELPVKMEEQVGVGEDGGQVIIPLS